MCSEIPSIVTNFRLLNPKKDSRPRSCIYRSSTVDYLEKIEDFNKIGFKTVIDLRSHAEYKRTGGEKLIDSHFSLNTVSIGLRKCFKRGQTVQYSTINSHKSDINNEYQHYLINFLTPYFIWEFVRCVPILQLLHALFIFLIDLVTGPNAMPNIGKRFNGMINSFGIIRVYTTNIDCAQSSICAALKLLLQCSGDEPVLICCAHGKDRTGILSALIQSCLGWSDDEIAKNYAKSYELIDDNTPHMEGDVWYILQKLLEPIRPHMRSVMCGMFGLNEEFLSAREDTMVQLLQHIRLTYGSTSAYMEVIGFGQAEQEKLRRKFGQ